MEMIIENKINISSGKIIGIMDQEQYFINYLENIGYDKNNIVLDGKRIIQKDILALKKRISIIENYITDDDMNFTVWSYMKNKIFNNMLDIKDYRKKINDSLKIVGLNENCLEKEVSKLSKVEKQWINFSIGLFSNPDIIVLNRVFHSLDMKNEKKLIRLLNQLVEQYNKIVIICTNDSEIIYRYTKETIIIRDSKVLVEGNTGQIFQDNYDILKKNQISIPKTVEFSYLVNKKGIKLGYFKDIRDLIKDIYKKV